MRRSGHALILLLSAAGSLISCGPTRYIKPLPDGRTRMQVSSGVLPIFQRSSSSEGQAYSVLAFLGGTSVAVGHGITEDLTGWVAMYPAFLFAGSAYFEIGCLGGLITPRTEGIGLSLGPRMHTGFTFANGFSGNSRSAEFFFMPQVDLNAYYEFERVRPHIGVSTFLPFMGESQDREFTIDPMLQAGLTLKSPRTDITFEIKTRMQTINGSAKALSGIYGLSVSVAGH